MTYRTLLLPAGLQRNNTPYDTAFAWWDMSQVRWQHGTLLPIGGWQRVTTISPAPVLTSATPNTTEGGTLPAGTYYYKITAVNTGGESLPSNEVSATLSATGKIILAWTSISSAVYYNIYRGTTSGGENLVYAANVWPPPAAPASPVNLGPNGVPNDAKN